MDISIVRFGVAEIGERPFSAGGVEFRAYTQDHGYSKTKGCVLVTSRIRPTLCSWTRRHLKC